MTWVGGLSPEDLARLIKMIADLESEEAENLRRAKELEEKRKAEAERLKKLNENVDVLVKPRER